MLLLSVYLGKAGLTDVGFRFYDSSEAPLAPRATAGVIDGGDGWYSVNVDVPANAASVRWDSAGTPRAKAREYFAPPAGLTDSQSEQLTTIVQKTALIQSGKVTAVFPVSGDGTNIQLICGDDYRAADSRALEFSSEDWPDLTGATVLFKLGSVLSVPATITAAHSVRVELTAAQTRQLKSAQLRHELDATLANGHATTLLRGSTTVISQL